MKNKHRFHFGIGSKGEPLSLDYCGLLCPNRSKCQNNPSEVKEKCNDIYKGKDVLIDFIPEFTSNGEMICTNIRIVGEKIGEKENENGK